MCRRRLGRPRPRARGRGRGSGRRGPAAASAATILVRERPGRRRRDDGRRAAPRAGLRGLGPESAADVPRAPRRTLPARRVGGARRGLPLQPARAALRARTCAWTSPRATPRPRSIPSSRARSWSSSAWRDSAQFAEIVRAHEAGKIPADGHVGRVPDAVRSRRRRPPGKHTAFMWEKLPYRLQRRPRQLGRCRARSTAAPCSISGRRTRPISAVPCSAGSRGARSTRERTLAEHARAATCSWAPSRTGRSATTGRSRAPATTARRSPALPLRRLAPSRRQRHRACPATTRRRSFSPTWACPRRGLPSPSSPGSRGSDFRG